MNTKSFKLATLALMTSFYVGNVVAEEVKSAAPQVAEKIAEQFHPDDLAAAARVLGQLGQFYQDK